MNKGGWGAGDVSRDVCLTNLMGVNVVVDCKHGLSMAVFSGANL